MILIVDNYDSFTYNLVHLVGPMAEVEVVRNDALTVAEIQARQPDMILISPGPGRPADAGITPALIAACAPTTPILGVCLGHQAIGEHFGGEVVHAPALVHGKISAIQHDGQTIFREIPQNFNATRYHSLVVARKSIPDCLTISAETSDGIVMGLRHKTFPVEGIQFHPESLLTTEGARLIKNWIATYHPTKNKMVAIIS